MNFSTDYDYIFLPGYGNSLGDHWQAQWFNRLPNSIWVEQKDWDHPIKSDWVSRLDKVLAASQKPVVIIAHSLGCLTFVEWFEQFASHKKTLANKIHAAFLVAVPDSDAETFPSEILGFEKMKLHPLKIKTLIVASLNDPYATQNRVELFSGAWGAELKFIGNAGHINTNAGFGAWNDGLKCLSDWLIN